MFGHVALDEHRRHVGVEADGEEHGGEFHRALADDAGRLGDREGVQVDDAVERVTRVLAGHPVPQRSEVVPEVHVARGLHAGQDARQGCWRLGARWWGGHGARG